MRAFSDRPLAYVRLPAGQPEAAARFAEETIGLERVEGVQAGLRSDDRCQTLAFLPAAAEPAVGIEARDEEALRQIAERLRAAGEICEPLDAEACRDRRIHAGFAVNSPSGLSVELVARVEQSARRFYPRRDSGVVGLSAVGLRSRDIERDLAFWTGPIGAQIRDRVGDIAYLGLDGVHHRIALYPSARTGLLYVGFGVRTHDDVMRNAYFLQERQVRVVHGPGCETASGRTFVRFLAPDGQMLVLDHGESEVAAFHRPRQFALDKYALCAWGSPCRDVPELAAA